MYPAGGLFGSEGTEHNSKKKTFTYREKSAAERLEYLKVLEETPEKKRVYVDESGIRSYLQREYGRALRGKKVEDTKRGSSFRRVNVIGGRCNGGHIAVECYTHTTKAAFFEQWFADCLLKAVPRACTVIMDNASFHRKAALAAIVKKKRRKIRLLFLPPYSPDLNPIEKSWANMKRYLRSHLPLYESVEAAIYHYFLYPVI